MKDCIESQKYNSCKHRAWNGDRSRLRCALTISPVCVYKPDFICIEDVKPDTIMYTGDIEHAGEFLTKADWIKQFGRDDFEVESDKAWYTASVKIVEISLSDLLDSTAENEEMYEGWYSDVLPGCEKDVTISEGLKKLNEILSCYPSYTEDQRVIFG